MSVLVMCADIPVLEFDFDEAQYTVYRKDLLPYQLRNRILTEPPKGFKQVTALVRQTEVNKEAIFNWLASRVLLLSRANAKWLYNMIGVQQLDTVENKVRIALICRGVSVLDNYWVKLERDTKTWSEVNLRHIPLNEIVTQVALHGEALTLQGSLNTPEFTTNGAYAKGWRRHEDGKLWLHKLGAKDATESRIEVMCSNLLDKMNVQHVHYELGEDHGKTVCMCPCLSDDNLSILPDMDFYSYCSASNLDYRNEVLKIDAESYYKMHIVDYLISNRDRHGQNWGMLYSAVNGNILRCHDLFDHNNAFDLKYMQNPDEKYLCTGKSFRESAKYAKQKVDFHFTAPIERSDFITQRQYDSFMSRADELGIETIVEKPSVREQYFVKYGMVDSQEEVDRLLQLFGVSSESLLWEKVERDLL